jgi:Domain of unknown function (DUF1707)
VEGHLRASDEDRDRAVASLADHLLAGRLSLEEFTDRIEMAYGAKVGDDLEALQVDLPPVPPAPARHRKPTRFTTALVGHVVRQGQLNLRRWTAVSSILAGIDLDLRQVEIDGTMATVNVIALFGKVDVFVPDTIHVDTGGLSVFGHQRHWGQEVARADATSIRVRFAGLVGSIDVWSTPSELQGSHADIINEIMRLQVPRPP